MPKNQAIPLRIFRVFRAYSRRAFLPLALVLLCLVLASCSTGESAFGGGSWQVSGLNNQSIQTLAVNPDHAQDLFAGDAQVGVFVSVNAGGSWRASNAGLPLPLAIHALAFDTTGKKLYAATSMGLFVSSDLANSWTRVPQLPTDDYSALSFDIDTPQVLYVASAHHGVLLSRDGGQSWTDADQGLPAQPLTSVLYDATQKTLWASTADTIYRADANGVGWQAMSKGLPGNAGIHALALGAVTGNNSDLLFAGTEHGFFITSDAGQHWVQSQFSLENIKIRAILLDATQPAVVYAATDIGVLRSNDSGQTWSAVGTGLPNKVFTSLAQGDTNNAQLFAAANGVYRYPGSNTAVSPSRALPALLILLFFLLLYVFFTWRRRRRPARSLPTTNEEAELSPEKANDQGLNGHRRRSENAPKDKPEES